MQSIVYYQSVKLGTIKVLDFRKVKGQPVEEGTFGNVK